MARIDQSRVRSGYDVEALLSERYLQVILATALDAGLIPSELKFESQTVSIAMLQDARLYEPTLDESGIVRNEHEDAFKTEILFGHPLGANLRIRAMEGRLRVDFDVLAQVTLTKGFDEAGALSDVGMDLHVVDIQSSIMDFILKQAGPPGMPMPIEELLAIVQEKVDRSIDLGSASKFKKVEDIDIKWHEADDDHPACLGVYVNVRMRNGDPEEDFLPRRGDLAQARNFLPEDEDIAMASRPGMYADMARHVFCSTAVETSLGTFEHALRKSLLNPKSKRIGDLDEVHVRRIPPLFMGGQPVPQNGLRMQVEGEVKDPIEATNTDVTLTIDLRPKIASDGGLEWKTDFDVDLDAVFEFLTLWAAALMGILFGPQGALIFLGVVFATELGVGIGIGIAKEGKVQRKADATLADVIPDRLTIATRFWDPFYATLHQVVTKPSQAEFNEVGFMLCGKAFIGRQLVPPSTMFIRDETRDSSGVISGMRYQVTDPESVKEDTKLLAPGTHRRTFTPASEAEPDLWPLTLEEFKERLEDEEGPLVLARIPYFPSHVHIVGNQIDQLLCISGTEVDVLLEELWQEDHVRVYDIIRAAEGDAITQQVMADLGAGATQDEVDAEVEARLQIRTREERKDYDAPSALELARSGRLAPLLRFDVTPEEFVMLQAKKVIVADRGELRTVRSERVSNYLRDIPLRGEEGIDGKRDNLLERPRYRPTPAGPVFG